MFSCVRCEGQSSSMEVFTNLSLDLEPGGSVSQALDRYLTVSDPTLGHGPTMLSLIPPLVLLRADGCSV